jgi:hypothetical protein
VKNAVVNFSGYCSGVVVSPDGLVFTNHHCGFESIRSHSTVDHDYMLNGFYAKSYEEELPNEDMFVSFMIDQQDITPRLRRLGLDTLSDSRKAVLIDSLQNAMTDSIHKTDSMMHVDIDAFYEGNRYYATTYQDFPDLRLVFTVPKSMGKFGGETDNWMWRGRPATSRCSASTPTPRPTVRPPTPKTTCPTTPPTGHPCRCRATARATSP